MAIPYQCLPLRFGEFRKANKPWTNPPLTCLLLWNETASGTVVYLRKLEWSTTSELMVGGMWVTRFMLIASYPADRWWFVLENHCFRPKGPPVSTRMLWGFGSNSTHPCFWGRTTSHSCLRRFLPRVWSPYQHPTNLYSPWRHSWAFEDIRTILSLPPTPREESRVEGIWTEHYLEGGYVNHVNRKATRLYRYEELVWSTPSVWCGKMVPSVSFLDPRYLLISIDQFLAHSSTVARNGCET